MLLVDTHGVAADRPATRWLSPRTLQITIPNKSLIGLQKPSYGDIEVVIKYEPDDPAERERWLRSLGLQKCKQNPRGGTRTLVFGPASGRGLSGSHQLGQKPLPQSPAMQRNVEPSPLGARRFAW